MNVNTVFLAGRLCRDPQVSYTPSQMAVCEFSVAVNRKWKSASGEQKEEVAFVEVKTFGAQAETIGKHFSKGKEIFVAGHLALDSWESQGQKRSKLYVLCDRFEFVGAPDAHKTRSPSDASPASVAADVPMGNSDIPF